MAEEPTLGEIYRAFIDFRNETRDQLKFVTRLLIGTLVSAVLGNIAAAAIAVVLK